MKYKLTGYLENGARMKILSKMDDMHVALTFFVAADHDWKIINIVQRILNPW